MIYTFLFALLKPTILQMTLIYSTFQSQLRPFVGE